MKSIAFLSAIFLIFSVSNTSGGLFDSMKELEGKVIIIAGDVEVLTCPIGGEYDCLSWPSDFLRFRFRDFCFTSDFGACTISCKGFIAVGKNTISYFFKFDNSFLSKGLTKHSVNYYECPDLL